jgi:cation:H+ antiporter
VINALTLAAGLVLLLAGAEMMVRGASRMAIALGIAPLIVGLTIVAFGTSSPELAVGVRSALTGEADIALGNTVGSSIFNILVILGLSAVITPLVVAQQLVRFDVPLMVGCSILVYALGWDGRISRLEGAALAAGLFAYLGFLFRKSRQESQAVREEYAQQFGQERCCGWQSWLRNVGLFIVGFVLLIVGSSWLVDGAASLARAAGVSELIIGLTVVAAGTSLPEAATSVVAALRGERDIAVGNAVGSNIFNILSVLGLTSLVAPGGIGVPSPALAFDIPVMIAVAVATFPIFFTGNRIARWEGWLFLGAYGAYLAYVLLDATQHDALPLFSTAMLIFVLPFIGVTLLVLLVREVRALRQPIRRARE